jgi:hypothetical protein
MNIKKLALVTPVIALLLSSATFLNPAQTSAVTSNEWSAGRIIDDGVFTDNRSMSVQEIQWFLMSKVPNCDNNGTGSVNGTTRAAYAESKGNPRPSGAQTFTCLRDYYEVPKTTPGPGVPASNYGYASGHIPAGGVSAAQLILDAAQAYSISPKTLLVTLQKEQGLVTDDWPLNNQYLYATGAYCPDGPNGAQCDPNYAGFSIQMREAAKLMRGYLDNMTQPWWPYKKPYSNNTILWNTTNTNCGSSNVYIETMATAALYTYTPYQPNQAALNNLYGTGDGCSAYGNRNFWRMFNDWFGSVKGDLFNASVIYQSPHQSIIPGQSKPTTVKLRNSGQWSWHDNSVNWPGVPPFILAASTGPSMLSYGWYASNIPSTVFSKVYEADGTTLAGNQHIVTPGQVGEFTFNLTVPWTAQPGQYFTGFKAVMAGTLIDLGPLSEFGSIVTVPQYFSSEITDQTANPVLAPGESKQINLNYRNNGQWTWHDASINWPGLSPIQLTTTSPSMFSYGWQTNTLVTKQISKVYEADGTTLASDQHSVGPSQIAQFSFNVTPPWGVDAANYPISFVLSMPGTAMDQLPTSRTTINVNVPTWRATKISQSAFPTIPKGQSSTTTIRYKNTGAWSWHDETAVWPGIPAMELSTIYGPTAFSYGWPSSSVATRQFNKVYEGDGTTLAANQHVAMPGQIVQFQFPMTTPWAQASGSYSQYFKPVLHDNAADFSDAAIAGFNITVP